MGFFFNVSEKELLKVKNKLFIESGLPVLKNNAFKKSPFSNALFGKNNLGDYTYELCRLSTNSKLEIITVEISKGDSWIKIFLNIIQLKPSLKTLDELNNLDGMQFNSYPNNISKMRLRIDDIKGVPFFHLIFGKQHKIGSYYTKYGFNREVKKLSELITLDLTEIDYFIEKWYTFHNPLVTDWIGNPN